jgi:hypothetical protein
MILGLVQLIIVRKDENSGGAITLIADRENSAKAKF